MIENTKTINTDNTMITIDIEIIDRIKREEDKGLNKEITIEIIRKGKKDSIPI